MTKRVQVRAEVELEYWTGTDIPGQRYLNMPVDPDFTNELEVAIRFDDLEADPRVRIQGDRRPQVNLVGSPRALEAFGRYLIALARLDSADPDPHEHFEDVRNADGGTVHLIVHRAAI
jgi:hypothetical protein